MPDETTRILSGLPSAELKGSCRNKGSGCASSKYQPLDKDKRIEVVILHPKAGKAKKGAKPVYVLKGTCSRCKWKCGRILSSALIKHN